MIKIKQMRQHQKASVWQKKQRLKVKKKKHLTEWTSIFALNTTDKWLVSGSYKVTQRSNKNIKTLSKIE